MPQSEPYFETRNGMPRFRGKFRGVVTDNKDPLFLARLKIQCPAVPFDELPNWAMPCTPYAGPGVGMYFMPPIGANVWVEFEDGDPNYPIWVGGYWDVKADVPLKLKDQTDPDPIIKVLKTAEFTLTLDDTKDTGSLLLNCSKNAVTNEIDLACNKDGVKLVVFDSGGTAKATVTMNADKGITIDYPNANITLTADDMKLTVSSSIQTLVDKKVTIDTADTEVTGNVQIDKDLVVKGKGTIEKDLAVKGNTTVDKNTTVSKDLTVSGKASITGATTISSNTSITGNLTVS